MAAVIPNFFIVGAPKCGTTALYEYLRPHPNIFMPRLKEPHYFAKDLGSYPFVKRGEAYAALFADRTDRHLMVGEASVYYLRSSTAIRNIREYNPDARLIAMFRNPVDMVHSFHSQLLYVSQEDVEDFETAWRLQGRRSQGLDLPVRSRGAFLLQYAEMARFGTQAQRLLSIFPAAQVKVILFDDFAASPQRAYDEVIDFLGIPHDGRTDFPRINENKRASVGWLRDLMVKPPPGLRDAYVKLKRAVGGKYLDAIKHGLIERITVTEGRSPLSPQFRAELVETFREEVKLLSRVLNRDLSHWA